MSELVITSEEVTWPYESYEIFRTSSGSTLRIELLWPIKIPSDEALDLSTKTPFTPDRPRTSEYTYEDNAEMSHLLVCMQLAILITARSVSWRLTDNDKMSSLF